MYVDRGSQNIIVCYVKVCIIRTMQTKQICKKSKMIMQKRTKCELVIDMMFT